MTISPNNPIQHRRAFSLVEMLLVLTIITVMAIIAFPMISKARENAKIEQTQLQLTGLRGTAENYKLITNNVVNTRNNMPPIDWTTDKTFNSDDPAFKSPNPTSGMVDDSIERFVWACYQINDVRKSINAQELVDLDNDGFLEVRDSWGNMIIYVDYMVHTSSGDVLPERGNAAEPRPYFISAGPDGDFGSTHASATAAEKAAAEDNIKSFDVEGSTGQ